ncbi:ZFPL1 isoform 7, partial [Pan troglodytes]
DYNPNCRLCNIPLASRETTRLVCYDSFLQIDEVVSPEPEPLNTSDFSDWSSF